jgi:hypothetical protein
LFCPTAIDYEARAGSIYFGALDETSKWGLKKKLSKKKN